MYVSIWLHSIFFYDVWNLNIICSCYSQVSRSGRNVFCFDGNCIRTDLANYNTTNNSEWKAENLTLGWQPFLKRRNIKIFWPTNFVRKRIKRAMPFVRCLRVTDLTERYSTVSFFYFSGSPTSSTNKWWKRSKRSLTLKGKAPLSIRKMGKHEL